MDKDSKIAIRDLLDELDKIGFDNAGRRRLTPRERAIITAASTLIDDVARDRPGVIDIDGGAVELIVK